MSLQSVKPDVVSYNAILSAYEKGSQWESAVHLVSLMRTCGDVTPDVITYSAVTSACQQASEWQLGLQTFTAMKLSKMAPDVVVCNAAISSCEKGSNWQCLGICHDPMVDLGRSFFGTEVVVPYLGSGRRVRSFVDP
eukprot:s5884_g2.t1